MGIHLGKDSEQQGLADLVQVLTLCPGKSYEITFRLRTTIPNGRLTVYIGGVQVYYIDSISPTSWQGINIPFTAGASADTFLQNQKLVLRLQPPPPDRNGFSENAIAQISQVSVFQPQ